MTLLLAVLGASLLGSVHCAAMCGGFVCLYSGLRTGATPRREVAPHVAYNAGRLVSYLLLGVIAGSLGRRIDQIGTIASVGRLAAIISGTLMAVWGTTTLLAASGVRVPQPGVPRAVQTTLGGALLRVRKQSPTVRGAATGLLTTLLPCGWLYVFVATAAGTGRVPDAVLVMLFFWFGTLPMMAAVGAGAQRAFGAFQRRLPLVSAAAAVVLGVLSMAGKIAVRPPVEHTHVQRVVQADP
jgi:sulfite exporter TauE/SafE